MYIYVSIKLYISYTSYMYVCVYMSFLCDIAHSCVCFGSFDFPHVPNLYIFFRIYCAGWGIGVIVWWAKRKHFVRDFLYSIFFRALFVHLSQYWPAPSARVHPHFVKINWGKYFHIFSIEYIFAKIRWVVEICARVHFPHSIGTIYKKYIFYEKIQKKICTSY